MAGTDHRPRTAHPGAHHAASVAAGWAIGLTRPARRFTVLEFQAGLLDPADRGRRRLDGQPAGTGDAIGADAQPITPADLARDEGPVVGPVEDLQTIRLDLGLDRAMDLDPGRLSRGDRHPGALESLAARFAGGSPGSATRKIARSPAIGIAIASIGYAASSRATLVLDSSHGLLNSRNGKRSKGLILQAGILVKAKPVLAWG